MTPANLVTRVFAVGLTMAVCAGCGRSAGASRRPIAAPGTTDRRSAQPVDPGSAQPGVPTSAPVPPPCQNSQVVASWTLRRRAAQLVVAPVQEADVKAVSPLLSAGVGGVILFGAGAPGDLGGQLSALVARAEGGVAPVVMTDEEGGGVQRMAELVGSLPWARTMAATDSPARVRALGESVGAGMRSLGVTMDLAPVLDLDGGPGPDALHPDGARSFSADPRIAATYGIAFAQGLMTSGVIPVVKHFPGLGTSSYNTDFGPATTAPLASLQGRDLLPFESAVNAGLPAVMVSNATVPGLSEGPASLSRAAVTGLLRHQLGFSGLVLTDSLSAGAISAIGLSPAQAAVRSVSAGVDMVLYGAASAAAAVQTGTSIIDALVSAVSTGAISDQVLDSAVAEVLGAKGIDLCPGS